MKRLQSSPHRKKIVDTRVFGLPTSIDHRPLVEFGESIDRYCIYMSYFDDGVDPISGLTPWLHACKHGHNRVICTLWPDITTSSPLEYQRDIEGNTGLLLACANKHAHTVKELIRRGHDLTVRNLKGETVYDVTTDEEVLDALSSNDDIDDYMAYIPLEHEIVIWVVLVCISMIYTCATRY